VGWAQLGGWRSPPASAGVSMRSTSPARIRIVHLSGSLFGVLLVPAGQQPVFALSARLAAGEPPGLRYPALGDQRQGDVGEHEQIALDPLTAGGKAGSTAPPPKPVAQHPHGEGPFERFHRRVLRVGHHDQARPHDRAPGTGCVLESNNGFDPEGAAVAASGVSNPVLRLGCRPSSTALVNRTMGSATNQVGTADLAAQCQRGHPSSAPAGGWLPAGRSAGPTAGSRTRVQIGTNVGRRLHERDRYPLAGQRRSAGDD